MRLYYPTFRKPLPWRILAILLALALVATYTMGQTGGNSAGGGSVTITGSLPAGTNNIGGVNVAQIGGTNASAAGTGGIAVTRNDIGQTDTSLISNWITTNNANGAALVVPYLVTGLTGNGLSTSQSAFEQSAILNAVGAATTQIVALSGSTRIRIGSVIAANTGAASSNWKLVQGTGTNCASGQTDLTTTITFDGVAATTGTADALTMTFPGAGLRALAGNAVCVTGSATGPLNTQVTFSQY